MLNPLITEGLDLANKVDIDGSRLRQALVKAHDKYSTKTHQAKLRAAPKNLALRCGHKLDILKIPSVNCSDCWRVFFISHKEMTHTNLTVLGEGKGDEIKKVHGEKYVKNLKRFAAFLYEMKQRGELNAND